MAEGRPRETLLKYEDPIESPLGDDEAQSQKGTLAKGLSGADGLMG